MAHSSDLTVELPDLAATIRLGRLIGELLRPGDVILLTGPLGAGKTTLTQAIGLGAGVPTDCYITSPTYALLHEYPARVPIYHLDLYRLNTEEEIEELGLADYLYGRGAAIVEWPERLGRLQPKEFLDLELAFAGEVGRGAKLKPMGSQWQGRLAGLSESWP